MPAHIGERFAHDLVDDLTLRLRERLQDRVALVRMAAAWALGEIAGNAADAKLARHAKPHHDS